MEGHAPADVGVAVDEVPGAAPGAGQEAPAVGDRDGGARPGVQQQEALGELRHRRIDVHVVDAQSGEPALQVRADRAATHPQGEQPARVRVEQQAGGRKPRVPHRRLAVRELDGSLLDAIALEVADAAALLDDQGLVGGGALVEQLGAGARVRQERGARGRQHQAGEQRRRQRPRRRRRSPGRCATRLGGSGAPAALRHRGGEGGGRGRRGEQRQDVTLLEKRDQQEGRGQRAAQAAEGGEGVEPPGGVAEPAEVARRQADGIRRDGREQHAGGPEERGGGEQGPGRRGSRPAGERRGEARAAEEQRFLARRRQRQQAGQRRQAGLAVGQPSAPQVAQREGRQEDADDRPPDVDAVAEVGRQDAARQDLERHQHAAAGADHPVEPQPPEHAGTISPPVAARPEGGAGWRVQPTDRPVGRAGLGDP